MVNKENMRKWVAALRSGEFQQGKGFLAADYGDGWRFCCLGVACEVAIRDGLGLERHWMRPQVQEMYGRPSPVAYRGYDRHGEGVLLPEKVAQWLGLPSTANPRVGYHGDGFPVSASSANDTFDWGFRQIAAAIEEYYGLREE